MTAVYCPDSLAAALSAMGELNTLAVAGCTDVMVPGSPHIPRAHRLVDLSRVPELLGVSARNGYVDIGAGETFARLRHDPAVRQHLPALADVAATVGALQIQARATIGGNIANASPAGDSLPVLLALDAELVLAGPAGERTVSYDAMHVGYRRTAMAQGELIVRVRLPMPAGDSLQSFRKIGTRQAQAISKVSLAFAARRDGNTLRDVRFAAGSVAATPVRLWQTEAVCEGAPLDLDLAQAAGAAAATEVQPMDDVRSTAAYRRFVLARCVRRMVRDAGCP
ncbi:MAG: CO/xanthine dehydrogenase FAD-binding subunit [Pseudohongiellaceae bacterium]|jgi:CO/xanthine dehydrogenase FAD-binding subunit